MTPISDGRALAARLHDGPQQLLASIGVRLDLLQRDVPPELHDAVAEIARQVGLARQELRAVSRALQADTGSDQA